MPKFLPLTNKALKSLPGRVSSFYTRKRQQSKHESDIQRQRDLDKKLVFSMSKSRIPTLRQLKYIGRYMSRKESLALAASILVIFSSLFYLGGKFYVSHLEEVPADGGVYKEAMVGSPKYINPLYSIVNDVDNDISALVYSSLFKRNENGELANDLVESYSVSEDGKIYNITLISGAKWHDGTEVTVDDVIFTYNAIRASEYKSPLRSSFEGVLIERVDDRSFRFLLSDPYAAFLELLTFGILPSSIWSQVQPESAPLQELNLRPVGSGPFKAKELIRDEKSGSIKEYNLVRNDDYYGKKPHIDLSFKFYNHFEEAIADLNNNQVDGVSYLPTGLGSLVITPKTYNFHKIYLPQLTVVFFNPKTNPALEDKKVRQALAFGLDRNSIVNDILGGDAYVVDSPILANSFAYNSEVKKYEFNREEAARLLEEAGWKEVEITEEEYLAKQGMVEQAEEDSDLAAEKEVVYMGTGKWRKKDDKFLVVKLTSVDRNENIFILEEMRKYWEEIGVRTEIEIVPANRIQTEVIRPRSFEALFYGQVLGADPDPYAFWHSSQAKENGFNIANYSNTEVDKLLEDARLTSDVAARQEKYRKFQEIIAEDVPAIFMYSPVYTYLQSKNLKGFEVSNILDPRGRFSNISDWYLKTKKKINWEK